MTIIEVRNDARLRLAGYLLAASDWPEYEQTVKAYKAHRTADAAHKFFAAASGHVAVQAARALVGRGEGLSTLYGHALNGTWPAAISAADFQSAAKVADFEAESKGEWDLAETESKEVMTRADLGQYLDELFGAQTRQLVFVPNLVFPGRQSVATSSASEVVVALHPPIAWGTSHPWKYNERPDEVLAKLSEALARALFEAAAPAELKPYGEVFALAAATLFLRQSEGDAAGDQFMVMEKKTRGLKNLPAVVMMLEPILADCRAGKYTGLADYAGKLQF
jgi:hypothetical protein